jgi:hypothetical protein
MKYLKVLLPGLLALASASIANGQSISLTSNTYVRQEYGTSVSLPDTLLIQSGATATLLSGATLQVGGNLTNAGTLSIDNASTVVFTGNSSQQLAGVTAFGNLTKSGSGNLAVQVPLAVNGQLMLGGGTLTLSGSNALTLNGTATQTAGQVVGTVAATVGTSPVLFPIGTASNYLPVTMSFASGSAVASASVAQTNPTAGRDGHPDNPVLALWTLAGSPPSAATLVLQYPNAVRQTGFVQSQAFAANWNGTTWDSYRVNSVPSADVDPSSVTITNVGTFGTLGQVAVFWGDDLALPVELSAFSGFTAAEWVELKWTTATEKNNAGFDIERSAKPTGNATATWSKVGFVKGNGTTTAQNSYVYNDHTAMGKVTYRLKQIDYNGNTEYSRTIDVDAGVPKSYDLKQNYPNPFNPATTISYAVPTPSRVTIKVYDILGREIATLVNDQKEAGRYVVAFSGSRYASGVYFYRLTASPTSGGSSFTETKKMVMVK